MDIFIRVNPASTTLLAKSAFEKRIPFEIIEISLNQTFLL
jgi:hypothetical protein